MRMAHTCIRVKDLDASLEFYEKAFGFIEKRRRDFPDYEFTLVYLSLPDDSYELELTYNYNHEAYNLGDGYGHIAIASEDVEKSFEEHKQGGFNMTDLKGLPGSDTRYYFVMDPDGYKIEVIKEK